ncbi:MAG: RnfABCDGE type electron transport complex subunit D, partial [Treponema sp.]|nr:RnfABCDGE type electron transport complex subunit D [Treponema sp.]
MPEYANLSLEKFQKPQVSLARTTPARMWLVSLCAFFAIIQSSLGDSFSSLIVAASAVAAAVLVEFLFLHKSGKAGSLKDGSAVASALVLALFLPNQIHPLYAAAGAVFAMAAAKHSFGGLGSNWLNPAAAGWLFVRFSWPASFAAPLEASPFSFFAGRAAGGSAAGHGHIELLLSPYPGIIADRGVLALLFGAVFLIAFRANRFWIPVIYLAAFSFLARFAGALPYGGETWDGGVFFAIGSGGTLAAALFLAA